MILLPGIIYINTFTGDLVQISESIAHSIKHSSLFPVNISVRIVGTNRGYVTSSSNLVESTPLMKELF